MYSAAVVVAAFAAGVLGQNATASGNGTVTGPTVVYTTYVETAITTYCSEATILTFGEFVYTITGETLLTITDCPCTMTKPVIPPNTVEYTSCPPEAAATVIYPPETQAYVPEVIETYSAPLTIVSVTQQAGVVVPTGAPVQPTSPLFTGAASQRRAGGEVVVGVVAAVVALVL